MLSSKHTHMRMRMNRGRCERKKGGKDSFIKTPWTHNHGQQAADRFLKPRQPSPDPRPAHPNAASKEITAQYKHS